MKKLCQSCLYTKIISEYHKNKYARDGYHSYCKLCRSESRKGNCILINPHYVELTVKLELVETDCEYCNNIHYGEYGSGRFCSSICARSFSTSQNRDLINSKVSKTLTGRKLTKGHKEKLRKEKCYLQCKFCKKEFEAKGKRQYCSYQCWLDETRINKDDFYFYKIKCRFIFNVFHYPEIFDLSLLKLHGWYSASNRGGNLNGISRDHMFSVREGFDNDIDPVIISHPMNCKLMKHSENNKKHTDSSISLEELNEKIEIFENKFNYRWRSLV